MERSDVRSLYLLGAFLACAYALPFLVGAWAGTAHASGAWLGNLATVVIGGVMQGGVYAMFAVGLTLIFGVMRIINAAHGEMVMMGAYMTWASFFYLGINPLLSLVLTLPVAFLFGVAVQKLLLNAAVGAPELTGLLITFGLGLTMIYTVELIFTTDFRTIPYAPGTIQLTTGLAAALAVAGGALVSIQFGFNPETGVVYTLQAFAIVILGGRGNYVGALIGGLMLGVLENLVSLMVPNGTAMVELAAYGLMIFVLLIRPGGLMGVKEG